jgi:hypothetical protein
MPLAYIAAPPGVGGEGLSCGTLPVLKGGSMKKKTAKKLELSKETVKNLETGEQLEEVKGGLCYSYDRISCGHVSAGC